MTELHQEMISLLTQVFLENISRDRRFSIESTTGKILDILIATGEADSLPFPYSPRKNKIFQKWVGEPVANFAAHGKLDYDALHNCLINQLDIDPELVESISVSDIFRQYIDTDENPDAIELLSYLFS